LIGSAPWSQAGCRRPGAALSRPTAKHTCAVIVLGRNAKLNDPDRRLPRHDPAGLCVVYSSPRVSPDYQLANEDHAGGHLHGPSACWTAVRINVAGDAAWRPHTAGAKARLWRSTRISHSATSENIAMKNGMNAVQKMGKKNMTLLQREPYISCSESMSRPANDH
jgi:hypothetical protein